MPYYKVRKLMVSTKILKYTYFKCASYNKSGHSVLSWINHPNVAQKFHTKLLCKFMASCVTNVMSRNDKVHYI